MNRVVGKVVVRETGAPVPDLVVAIYDLDPDTRSEETFASVGTAPTPASWRDLSGDRLGSVLTGADGTFTLEYEDAEFRTRNPQELRPDLALFVTGPDDGSDDGGPVVLHATYGVRPDAGRTESFVLRIGADTLARAGIARRDGFTVDAVIARVASAGEVQDRLAADRRATAAARFAAARARSAGLDRGFETVRGALSRVPAPLLTVPGFVAPGRTIRDVMGEVLDEGRHALHQTVRSGVLLLTADQLAALQAANGGSLTGIPGELVEPYLRPDGGSTFALHEDPADAICREVAGVDDACEALLDGEGEHDHGEDPDGEADPPEPIPSDLEGKIGELLQGIASPEVPLSPSDLTRSDAALVQQSVDGLALGGGPADTVAFHDFHQLQIAFREVWMEAMDQGVLDDARAVYDQVVELGGTEHDVVTNLVATPFLATFGADTPPEEPPASVVKVFGATQEMWKVLSSPRRLSEEIVVPTDSLVIEALPGAHALLEAFKLRHRVMDVRRVQADVRRVELENLRLAARLLGEEYEDPDVERKIVVEGPTPDLSVPADGG